MPHFPPILSLFALVAALATVGAFLLAFGKRETVAAVQKRHGRMNLAVAGLLLAVCALFAVCKDLDGGDDADDPPSPPLMSAAPGPMIPDWFTALGYDMTDTDHDGIPDCWERWTRTDPAFDDSSLDPDGDGLDNFAEFWNQCDPILADTDGDGLPDALEVARAARGDTRYDPIRPADFSDKTPGWATTLCPFTDANGDGFADALDFLSAGDDNFDVTLSVSSSRHAVLTWGPTGDTLVLPPCTNLAVRLRLDAEDITHLRLASAPEGESPEGLWKARMLVTWSPQRQQESELNRVRLGDGRIVECSGMEVSYLGDAAVSPPLLFAGFGNPSAGGSPASIETDFTPLWLSVVQTLHSCPEHGPGAVVEAVYTNVPPVFVWNVASGLLSAHGNEATISGFENGTELTCTVTNGVEYTRLTLTARLNLTVGEQCHYGETNILGAAWTSTHNPTNAADHLPSSEVTYRHFSTPDCRVATNCNYKAGWSHAKSWIRNLRTKGTDARANSTDHTIALIWSDGMTIDLYDYLDDEILEVKDMLCFTADGAEFTNDHTLSIPSEPDDLEPIVIYTTLSHKESNNQLEAMWIVVNSRETENKFNEWHALNSTNLSWVAALPHPYASITFSTNFLGWVSLVDPEPGAPGHWDHPWNLDSNLHPDAHYEMRAYGNADGHGNQACYDQNGNLITSGMSGGTADFAPGFPLTVKSHIRHDVLPFLRAVYLDGNPGERTMMNSLTLPCLHEGDNIQRYIESRPITTP